MASNRRAKAMCDSCSFVYDMRVMRLNSYNLLICPECFEGQYDLKNHPQNKIPDVRDNPAILNPRPDTGGRNLTWDQSTSTYDLTEQYWQLI